MTIPIWLLTCIIIGLIFFIWGLKVLKQTDSGGFLPDMFTPIFALFIWGVGAIIIIAILIGKFIL